MGHSVVMPDSPPRTDSSADTRELILGHVGPTQCNEIVTDSAEERPRPRPRSGPDDGEPSAGGPRPGTVVGEGISPSWLGDLDSTPDPPAAVHGALSTAAGPAPGDDAAGAAVTDWPVWHADK